MDNLIPVEGRINLYRDANSGAIINTDHNSYHQYLKHMENVKNEKMRLQKLEEDFDIIKDDIMEIKNLLVKLTNNP